MATLYIRGQDEPITFDDKHFDSVNQIFSEYLEGKGDAAVKLPNETIRASQIKRVQKDRRSREAVALDDQEVRAFDVELEAFCEKCESETPETADLSRYGDEPGWKKNRARIFKNQDASPEMALEAPPRDDETGMKPMSDLASNSFPSLLKMRNSTMPLPYSGLHPEYTVNNNVLNLVHFGIVKYCEENQILLYRPTGWTIWDHGDEKHVVITPYIEFMRKWNAVGDLRGRRLFAQKQAAQAQGVMKGEV